MINFENHDDDPTHMPSFSEAVIRGMVDSPISISTTIISVVCVGIVAVNTVNMAQSYLDVPDGYVLSVFTGLIAVAVNSFIIGLNMSNSLTGFLIKILRRRIDLFDEFLKINEAIEKDLMATRQDLRKANLEIYRLENKLKAATTKSENQIDNEGAVTVK